MRPAHCPLVLRSTLLASLPALALAAGGETRPAPEGGPPVVVPGQTWVFPDAPNAVDGSCDGFALAVCNWVADETPLRAFCYGFEPLARATAAVHQDHEFELSDSELGGSAAGTLLDAVIAGSLDVGGFMYSYGGATACANVDLQVLDVTDDPAQPLLVFSGSIVSYRVESGLSVAIGASADVTVEGGFPYVGAGAGGGIGIEIGIANATRVLRNERTDFAFPVMLRRGRTYIARISLSTATHNRILGALSIASFFSPQMGGPVIPNPLNSGKGSKPGTEATWLSTLTEPAPGRQAPFSGRVGNYAMPKGDADLVSGKILGVDVTLWEQGLANPFNILQSSEAGVMQSSSKFTSSLFGLPGGSLMTPSRLLSSDFMRAADEPENEAVDLPGVQVLGLTLTVQDDLVELDQRARNRGLEQSLMGPVASAAAFLPREFGGELEDVIELVSSRITQFAAAGLPLNNAPYFLNLANQDLALGNYRRAYSRARAAYQLLIKD